MKYWRVSPGEGGYLWREQKLNECIAIGWSELGDLTGLDEKALKNKCLRKRCPNKEADCVATQLNDFLNNVEPEEKVIASARGKGVYAVGTIIGEYKFNDELEYKHSRKVQWETTFWHPVDIDSLQLSDSLYDKFHGQSSRTIRKLEEPEWNGFCKKLNDVPTPFRNLGMWVD